MKTLDEIKKISIFFLQFSKQKEDSINFPVAKEIDAQRKLFENIQPLLKEYEEYEIMNTPKYNVFSILKINTNEPKVHTPFLCDLLSSNGEHKQQDLYFKIFVEIIFTQSNELNDFKLIRVEREKFTRYGIIDILISCINKDKPFYLVIENKVYAGDQEKQLERYYNYLSNELKLFPEQFKILYLTPNGTAPLIPYSISQELYQKLTMKANLRPLSYKRDIVNWINRCIEETKPLPVKEVLKQYLQTIKIL